MGMAGCIVPPTDTVNTIILGVTIDRHLTFDSHYFTERMSSAYYHIRSLKHIRSCLPIDMAKTVASALVNSRLHYANSILYNTSSVNMLKLQRVQNSLARVVTYKKRVEHIHPVLHQLHTGFRSTKYGQREVQHTYSAVSDYVPARYGLQCNICSTCLPSERR